VSGTRIASVSGLRGIVGDGLDPVVVLEFAAAYATETRARSVVVGHDGRVAASVMECAVLAGVTGVGSNVHSVGPCATPTLGVMVKHHGLDGGIQISASHNPPEYSGLKFFQPDGMVLGPEQGRALVERFRSREFAWKPWDKLGAVEANRIDDGEHQRRLLAIVDNPEVIRSAGFKVVLDSCHGAGSRLGLPLLRTWCRDLLVLGGEPDGRYDHAPEPTESNLRDLASIVRAVGAHVGFAQDPDADRLAIIDETGRYIGEELTLALAALRVLDRRTGPVVLNLSTSRVTEDLAVSRGCRVHRTPVGEIHVVERMRAEGAIIGGEGNGGVIDPRVGYVRDSFVAMALVLELMAVTGEPLSQLVDRLPKYAMVKEKFPLGKAPVTDLLDGIAKRHADARCDRRDGLRLDWDDAWAHVRASNTEPIVRVIAEARDRDRASELADRLGRCISQEL
jgi:phosphomannomutase